VVSEPRRGIERAPEHLVQRADPGDRHGPFCGPITSVSAAGITYTFSGPYTVSGSGTAFSGVTGNGTLTLDLTVDNSNHLQHTGIGLSGTLIVPAGKHNWWWLGR